MASFLRTFVVLSAFCSALASAAPTCRTGDHGEVEWSGTWYAATVLEHDRGRCFIHYEGWGAEWNEWVTLARFRRPLPTTQTRPLTRVEPPSRFGLFYR